MRALLTFALVLGVTGCVATENGPVPPCTGDMCGPQFWFRRNNATQQGTTCADTLVVEGETATNDAGGTCSFWASWDPVQAAIDSGITVRWLNVTTQLEGPAYQEVSCSIVDEGPPPRLSKKRFWRAVVPVTEGHNDVLLSATWNGTESRLRDQVDRAPCPEGELCYAPDSDPHCWTDPSVVSPAFRNTWYGTAEARYGDARISYPAQLSIDVSGTDATIAGVCLDGSGSLVASGSLEAVNWSGTLACAPAAFGTCEAVTVTYDSLDAELNHRGVFVRASGRATGCDGLAWFSFGFQARLP